MQTITLELKPSPRLPVEVLDQVIQRAEREQVTPEEWVFNQIQKGLAPAETEDTGREAVKAA